MTEHGKSNLWYARRGAVIEGPYPAGQISRYLLLGRLRQSDEVSQDGKEWYKILQCRELVPELMLDDDPDAKERLLMSRMHEDEREPGDRRDEQDHVPPEIMERRGKKNRRRPEDHLTEEQREQRFRRWKELNKTQKPAYLLTMLAGLAFVTLVIVVVIVFGDHREFKDPDCNAPPGPNVNWRNCQLEGAEAEGKDMHDANLHNATLTGARFAGVRLNNAELSYARLGLSDLSGADLSGARLFGTYLEQADLRGAKLKGADLSYAILRQARLDGVDLSGVHLEHAVWVDGSTCQAGSVGECLIAK